jgi:hypothetical protein
MQSVIRFLDNTAGSMVEGQDRLSIGGMDRNFNTLCSVLDLSYKVLNSGSIGAEDAHEQVRRAGLEWLPLVAAWRRHLGPPGSGLAGDAMAGSALLASHGPARKRALARGARLAACLPCRWPRCSASLSR